MLNYINTNDLSPRQIPEVFKLNPLSLPTVPENTNKISKPELLPTDAESKTVSNRPSSKVDLIVETKTLSEDTI
jgi:hypothetical protein